MAGAGPPLEKGARIIGNARARARGEISAMQAQAFIRKWGPGGPACVRTGARAHTERPWIDERRIAGCDLA
jgi:hypothetical protein